MLVKNKLTESFIIQGKIDKVSSVDTRLIKNHILSNFTLTNRYDDSQYWYMKDYVKVPYHQHIQWVQDWLRDHYRSEHDRTLVPTPIDSIRVIVQQTSENVNTHHNVKDWHLGESPEVSCLYTVATGKEKSFVVFEYDDGRNKGTLKGNTQFKSDINKIKSGGGIELLKTTVKNKVKKAYNYLTQN